MEVSSREMTENKKYLGVLPVPERKTRFSKIQIFMIFCIFFYAFNFNATFLLDRHAKCVKRWRQNFEIQTGSSSKKFPNMREITRFREFF